VSSNRVSLWNRWLGLIEFEPHEIEQGLTYQAMDTVPNGTFTKAVWKTKTSGWLSTAAIDATAMAFTDTRATPIRSAINPVARLTGNSLEIVRPHGALGHVSRLSRCK
jgi:hypothetical protein